MLRVTSCHSDAPTRLKSAERTNWDNRAPEFGSREAMSWCWPQGVNRRPHGMLWRGLWTLWRRLPRWISPGRVIGEPLRGPHPERVRSKGWLRSTAKRAAKRRCRAREAERQQRAQMREPGWRMAAQIVPDHVKSHGPCDKTRPAGVPNPPKVISSIQKAISVGSASPLFSVGTLFLRATIQRGCPVIFGGDCPATPAAPRGAVYTRSSIAVAKQRLEVRRSSEVPE